MHHKYPALPSQPISSRVRTVKARRRIAVEKPEPAEEISGKTDTVVIEGLFAALMGRHLMRGNNRAAFLDADEYCISLAKSFTATDADRADLVLQDAAQHDKATLHIALLIFEAFLIENGLPPRREGEPL